jgi:hypothetical protein
LVPQKRLQKYFRVIFGVSVLAPLSLHILVPTISPSTLERAVFGGGSLLVIVMLHKGLSAQLAWKRTALIIPIILVLMVAFGTGLPEVVSVGKDVEAADKRCADIEREMLSARPRRSDLPDIFSALGCHVSGQQDIAYPSADKQQKNS